MDDTTVALGGENNKIYFVNLNDKKETLFIENANLIRGNLLALAFSPDGKFLASTDKNRHIWVWDINSKTAVNEKKSFQYHVSPATNLTWSNDSKQLLSGGHDNSLYLWTDATSGNNDNIKLESYYYFYFFVFLTQHNNK